MPDIYGSHFEYAGVSSRIYGLIIANVETSRFTQISGAINGVSVFNKNVKKRYLIDDDYTDFPISYEVEIITDDDSTLDMNKRREIEKWLFNKHDYRRFYIDIDDDTDGETYEVINGIQRRLYLNCRFVNATRLEYNGGIVGFRATIEADSGLWWQEPVTDKYMLGSYEYTNVIHVNVDSDIDDYIYPKVTIKMRSTNSSNLEVTIINSTDDSTRLTKFVGLSTNATIVLNGELNSVSGQYYEKFVNQNFPRLLDGDNMITVIGDVEEIWFEYSNRRAL